jgi:two-component system response regulator FixJ
MFEVKGFEVTSFSDGASFLTFLGSLDRPACLLLDIRMPGADGMTVLEQVSKQKAPLQVVMITGHADVPTAVKAMKFGAVDFIEKPFTQPTIMDAVAKAADALEEKQAPDGNHKELDEKLSRLSPREREVMEHLVDGLTNKEIARQLDISPRTVEVYRAGVMDKMGARNLSSLVKMGFALGLGT